MAELADLRYGEYAVHPLAELWGNPRSDDYDAIVESIESFGLARPIIRMNGQIIDGRVRLSACIDANVKPVFTDIDELTGDALVERIASENLHSRLLGAYERANIVIRMFEWRETGITDDEETYTNKYLARIAGCSVPTIKRAKKAYRKEHDIPPPPGGSGERKGVQVEPPDGTNEADGRSHRGDLSDQSEPTDQIQSDASIQSDRKDLSDRGDLSGRSKLIDQTCLRCKSKAYSDDSEVLPPFCTHTSCIAYAREAGTLLENEYAPALLEDGDTDEPTADEPTADAPTALSGRYAAFAAMPEVDQAQFIDAVVNFVDELKDGVFTKRYRSIDRLKEDIDEFDKMLYVLEGPSDA